MVTENVLTEFPSEVEGPSLFITRGIPASGKSTGARKFCAEDPEGRVSVEKDRIREMLSSGFVRANEHLVHKTSVSIVKQWLSEGRAVVCSDTNLPNKSVKAYAEIAEQVGCPWFVVDFTDVPLEELHRRNNLRIDPQNTAETGVPPRVIDDMYQRFVKGRGHPLPLPEVSVSSSVLELYEPKDATPSAILVDIDGTLAHMNGRSPYDWGSVGGDTIDEAVAGLLGRYTETHVIVVMSGRDGSCYDDTAAWLLDNGVAYDHLYMRSEGDTRKDSVVKYELFNYYVRDRFDVEFVLDDRDQVVDMWRSLGIKCLQVAPGDF